MEPILKYHKEKHHIVKFTQSSENDYSRKIRFAKFKKRNTRLLEMGFR